MGLKKTFDDATVMTAILALHYRCLQDYIVGVNKCFYDAMPLQFICLLYSKA